MNIQLPIPAFDLSYHDLIDSKHELVSYVQHLNLGRIERLIDTYYSGTGPNGFRKISLFLLDMLKIKKNIPSNRRLIREIKEQRLWQHLTFLASRDRVGRYVRKARIPTHQTISHYHRSLGTKGFREILALTVEEANELGLLAPARNQYRQGIHLAQDSTFTISKVTLENFKKNKSLYQQAIGFGRSHKHKFPFGQKVHWLLSVPRRIIVNLAVSPAQDHDGQYVLPLMKEFVERHQIKVAYHIGDKGLSDDFTRQELYRRYGTVGIYPLKENAVFPKSFNKEGWPLCPHRYPLKRKGTDYKRQRTQYYCDRICLNLKKKQRCSILHSDKVQGYTFYTKFEEGMGKFGPVPQATRRFEKLYDTRTFTEQINSLIKVIRYHFEENLTATDPTEVEIQALLYAICLNYDEIVKERKCLSTN